MTTATSVLLAAARLFGLGLASLSLGAGIGLFAWQSCYHQQDLTKAWGMSGMLLFTLVGMAVLAISAWHRPAPSLLGVIVPIVIVAAGAYWWLLSNTAATRCPWYDEPPVSPAETTIGEPSTP